VEQAQHGIMQLVLVNEYNLGYADLVFYIINDIIIRSVSYKEEKILLDLNIHQFVSFCIYTSRARSNLLF